jgi:siroheme synthase-like protein
MDFSYPLILDLKNKPVLVVGAGMIAYQKCEALLKAGAKITLMSPEINSVFKKIKSKLKWIKKKYDGRTLEPYYLVVAATNDAACHRSLFVKARKQKKWINVVDVTEYCNVIVPAQIQKGKILLSISTGGHAPAFSGYLKRYFERYLTPDLVLFADLLAKWRPQIKRQIRTIEGRKDFWIRFITKSNIKKASSGKISLQNGLPVLRNKSSHR